VTSLLCAGCQQSPRAFVAAFDAALASEDPDRVAGLLTPASRPIFRAMIGTPKGPAPDPQTGVAAQAGERPFAPRAPGTPTELLAVRAQSDGSLLLQVSGGEEPREWVVRPTAGVLQLDLLATSARTTWAGEHVPTESAPSLLR